MQAGRLDRRINIQAVVIDNSGLESVEVIETMVIVWASKHDTSGGESMADDQLVAQAETVFRIRWIDGVKTTMKIICEDITYNILAIKEIGRHEGLDIRAVTFTENN